MPHQLSIGRVWKRDWPAFGLSIFLGLIWLTVIAGYVVSAVWYPQDAEGGMIACVLGIGAAITTILCGAVIVWRIHIIRHVFARGEVVRGQVLSVGENSENIGYAVVTYEFQGHKYLVNNTTEGAGGRRLTPDEAVDIVVDPSKPSRAFIARLFLE